MFFPLVFLLCALDGSNKHFSKCRCKSSIVTISSQPFSLYSQQIFCLSTMFFNIGTTGFKSFSLILPRHCGHVLFLFIYSLTHAEQKTCLHGDSTGSSNTPVHMQQINSESTSPGKRSTSQPIIYFDVHAIFTAKNINL